MSIDSEKYHVLEKQEITLKDFSASGWVLDIGGGGEGTIGVLKNSQVVAIDLSDEELRDAPAGPLKIIMNATRLKFLDNTFQTATGFYFFQFLPAKKHLKIFKEVFRVLAPEGKFLIWAPNTPARNGSEKKRIAFYLTIHLPKQTIETGYGGFWEDFPMDLDYFSRLGKKAGFEILQKEEANKTLFLELQKPKSNK